MGRVVRPLENGMEAVELDVEETLRRVRLFEGFQPKQIKSLAKWTTTRTYQPDQVIVSEGQTGLGLYCIQSGQVRVTQNTPGGTREVRTMGPGETFGELSLLDDKPRSATVTAVEPTTAILLDKSQFRAELRAYPEIAIPMLEVLSGWIREADLRIAELS